MITGTVKVVTAANGDLESLRAIQREIQRKFGRNLLRLQQYERLMKGVVAEQEVAGPIGELHNIKARQMETVSQKTLGQVVGDFTGLFITPALPDSAWQQDDESPRDPGGPWARIKFQIEMREEDIKETERKLAGLVSLRNELAHHFLENRDIETEAGCLSAEAYLDDCYKQIDEHCGTLREWAKHNLELRKRMVDSITKRSEFCEFLFRRIMPEETSVFWASSIVVNLLRNAEAVFAKDGWASLQQAVGYIHQHEPEHTPKRYGCSSWRHLLHV